MAYQYPIYGAINFTLVPTTTVVLLPRIYPVSSDPAPTGAPIHAVSAWVRPWGNSVNFAYPMESIPAVTGDCSVTLDFFFSGEQGALIPIEGIVSVGVSFDVSSVGGHGSSGIAAASLEITPAFIGTHPRYEVKGEVRKQGILIDRRVRVYSRSTGQLLGQKDTSAGKFKIHCGFSSEEVTIMPIDLSGAADDFTPPCSNRVVSLLAQDS